MGIRLDFAQQAVDVDRIADNVYEMWCRDHRYMILQHDDGEWVVFAPDVDKINIATFESIEFCAMWIAQYGIESTGLLGGRYE